jgi:hypothetical protein
MSLSYCKKISNVLCELTHDIWVGVSTFGQISLYGLASKGISHIAHGWMMSRVVFIIKVEKFK